SGALPIHDVSLYGSTEKNQHTLNWKIIADEPVKTVVIEASDDGNRFGTLTTAAGTATNFSYHSYKPGPVYYRLKVTSILDQTVYSNTIALKGTGNIERPFYVSTLVRDQVTINAARNYQYLLCDMNGRAISKGTGQAGINKIGFYDQPDGMYIIRLFSNNEQQTERIIKQ
ncbi:MAG TPA: T9SS type A sorting domain-containing protein, partial [Ferruginibacter sp.]|nr:T9SS type A sorting domain-containing protein [Ferruginibacter sp.]